MGCLYLKEWNFSYGDGQCDGKSERNKADMGSLLVQLEGKKKEVAEAVKVESSRMSAHADALKEKKRYESEIKTFLRVYDNSRKDVEDAKDR